MLYSRLKDTLFITHCSAGTPLKGSTWVKLHNNVHVLYNVRIICTSLVDEDAAGWVDARVVFRADAVADARGARVDAVHDERQTRDRHRVRCQRELGSAGAPPTVWLAVAEFDLHSDQY